MYVYVHMSVYICLCMYVCGWTVWIYAFECMSMNIYLCMYVCVYVSVYVCLRMYACGCMCVDVCMSVDVYACESTDACRGRKGTSDTLELEVYGCVMWVLGTKLKSSARTIQALNHGATSPAPTFNFWKKIHHVFNKSCTNLQSCQ